MSVVIQIILYFLCLAVFFLDKHFAPIVNELFISGDEFFVQLLVYKNMVAIIKMTLLYARIHTNTKLSRARGSIILNLVFVLISTVLYVVMHHTILYSPNYFTFIWIADVYNLAVTLSTRRKTMRAE